MRLFLTLENIKLIGLYVSAWIMGFSRPMPRLSGRELHGEISHPPRHAPLRLLAVAAALLVLVALATFQGAPSLQAVVTTLISNTGQTTHATTVVTLGTGTSDDSRAAQSFVTGTNTDGYTVSSIGIKLATLSAAANAGTDLKLEIYSDASSTPDSAICTLADPATFTADAVNEFTAPTGAEACPRLLRNTNYHVVLERVATTTANSTVTVSTTPDNGEDTGGATGWSIGNHARKYASSWSAIAHNSLQIQIKGESVTKAAATGQPVIRASAEGAPYLFAETSGIRDGNGLPLTDPGDVGGILEFLYSYQWIRVDGDSETNIGSGSPRYQLVDADYGKLIKVAVSFTDQDGFPETVTSDPFRPVRQAADPLLTPATLVGNTGQTHSATASITKQYAQGFTLGGHGQGYELSGVSIELAAAPTDLNVSLWIADHADKDSTLESRLYDFKNPATFAVGENEFTAPPGVLLYPNVQYVVVLSGFTSLSIRETTSDAEDAGGEPGAEFRDIARVRDLGETGRWGNTRERESSAGDRETGSDPNKETPVLRLEIKGSQRASGILASTYGQPASGDQEITSLDDRCCIKVDVGAADRYLIRGFSWNSDDTTSFGGGTTNPFELREGSHEGDELARLFLTRNIAGVPEWSAPQGATVAGGSDKSYVFSIDWEAYDHVGGGSRTGHALTRIHGTRSTTYDTPLALGVTFSETGDVSIPQYLAAVLGEPLYAMVQNLGQTHSTYLTAGGFTSVVTQGFTTGSATGGYRLQGIGVNIEGSDGRVPDDATSVSVSLYSAHANGKPDTKLFDLVSPDEYAPGHSFFEAPAGKTLAASTTYVMVWTHNSGTSPRLHQTLSNGEDSGAFGGATIADEFYAGANLDNLTADSGSPALEIAVYTDTAPGIEVYTDISPGGNVTGQPVIRASAEGAPYLFAETTDIDDPDGLPFTNAIGEEGDIGDGAGRSVKFFYSYRWIRVDGETETDVGADSAVYHLVDADYGKLIKVEVSFADQVNFPEMVTSDPFRPVRRTADSLLTSATLVGNTGQTASATAAISKQYAQGFTLGGHGQGYELSGVSIELAAAPTALRVSLWIADHADKDSTLESRLYDFKNPAPFAVGANEFTAPPGVLLYPNIQYAVVLSGYTSLSIKETTSDAEDTGGETGAVLKDAARVRDLGVSGRWDDAADRETGMDPNIVTPVLRLAIKGSQRASGILASTYGQAASDGPGGNQELISLGDFCCMEVNVGAADRYLIRGFSWNSDDTTSFGGGTTNPFELREGSHEGDELVRLFITRNIAGVPEWSAPRGATVAGGSDKTYVFAWDEEAYDHIGDGTRRGHDLTRVHATQSTFYDTPLALGVIFSDYGDVDVPQFLAAVLGEPLYAMVQNLGQTNATRYLTVDATNKVASQAFTTGSATGGYRLQGIGVNIEGSDDTGVAQVPDDATSVTVSLYSAHTNGKPDTKLFDLVSPDEYAPGHSFFEAPAGKTLAASTTYVLVWRHNGGTGHRLQRTASNNEDSGAFGGATIANAFYFGASRTNLTQGGHALEIAVYTDTAPETVVYTDISPGNTTGLPVVLASPDGAGILSADTEGIDDEDGLPIVVTSSSYVTFHWSYQWIRVDGETEIEVGADSASYQAVEADVGKLIKVQVSFTDGAGAPEVVTSLPFGPIVKPAPSAPPSTLVSNTRQSPSTPADINQRYAVGFSLGDHGQGYDISSVSIDLAVAPSSLSVSLWSGGHSEALQPNTANKLLDFASPSSFQVGLNKFTAPSGAFAYQGVNYFIVLSGFGGSLSITETTSDAEDGEPGEPGAVIYDDSAVRALSDTGRWAISDDRAGVLRLAVEGSRRAGGILVSNYAQPGIDDKGTVDTADDTISQEIISVGDRIGFGIELGGADRYLIRGVSFNMDSSDSVNGGFSNPLVLRSGSLTGDAQFRLANTRHAAGLPVWTAPQGATVAGGCTTTTVMMVEEVTCKEYVFDQPISADDTGDTRRRDAILTRARGAVSEGVDSPAAAGVSITGGKGEVSLDDPYMAVHGEPLVAMVQNLGQTDDPFLTVGTATSGVASQGFTTGSNAVSYRLQGIGVNIEGSNSNMVPQIPDDSASVSASVHADSNGKPGVKLFDLLSPTEYAAGHSFFEAPPGTYLQPDTSYVLVWQHTGGTEHRLQRTASNSEDSGAASNASIADTFYWGPNLTSLSQGGHALEIAVYTEVLERAPLVPGEHPPVTHSWLHIPDGVEAGYQFRVLFVTHSARDASSGKIEDYNTWVQEEAAKKYNDPVVQAVAPDFKAVVCTADVDAPTNTGMPTGTFGVPVHWLDGGWEGRPTLIANSYVWFYGDTWVNSAYGAYATGNSAHFHENAMVWTGCDASGAAHPEAYMGSPMGMAAVGTPNDSNTNNAPLGAVDVDNGFMGEEIDKLRRLYAISPILTVGGDSLERTVWSSGITVGTHSVLDPSFVQESAGYDVDSYGSIGSTQFTYKGTSYSVEQIRTLKQTASNVVITDGLGLVMPTLLPVAADANLVLELNGTQFPLSTATRAHNSYDWTSPGLSWSDGNFVEVKLIELLD